MRIVQHQLDPHSLIGTPYVLGGTDPATGLDCWGLLAFVRRECFGLHSPIVPPLDHTLRAAMRSIADSAGSGCWHRVALPGEPGDAVGMSRKQRSPLHHVGVALQAGVLHAFCGDGASAGSVVLTPWRNLSIYFALIEVWRCRS